MNALSNVFENSRKEGKGVLVGYLTGGDPNPQVTSRIANALIEGGVDILELGVPFSDPIADGPVIQAASVRALAAGTTPRMVLEMAQEIKLKKKVPIVILTYFNPIFKMGVEDFFQYASKCLVDGVVVPDLPIEEADNYREAAEACGIDTIFLASPSTSNERLLRIIARTSGFLYLVSHFGVTGERDAIDKSTIRLVRRVTCLANSQVPVAVGFGISKPRHVQKMINSGADGVIVGSTFVNIVQRNQYSLRDMLEEIKETALKLKSATVKQIRV
ncbi:MAG TPA: tryptophan synthase subunit alpha [Candidatus Bathyarchaeia archaeon]